MKHSQQENDVFTPVTLSGGFNRAKKKLQLLLLLFLASFPLLPPHAQAQDFLLSGLVDARFNVKHAAGEKVPFGSTYRNGFTYNLELYPTVRLNDNWTVTGIFAHAKNANGKTEDSFDLYRLAINGQIGTTDVTAGSFKYWPMNGLINGDARLDGVKLVFGDKLRATAVIAKDMGWRHKNQQYRAIDFTAALTARLTLRGGYFTQHQETGTQEIGAVGMDLKLDNQFTLTTDYAFSPAAQPGDKSYIAGINYQGGKSPVAEKGRAGVWLHWIQAAPGSAMNADTDIPDIDGWHNNSGNRGITAGVAYMLAKNVKWSTKHMHFTDIVNGTKSQVYRTQVEVFF